MTLEWKISNNIVQYPEAIKLMEERVENIYHNQADEMVWLLEHPPLYTAGTNTPPSPHDLINNIGLPVYESGRGGKYTYHGPGQRVIYLMLDLKKREPDIRKYVENLEYWIISCLKEFGIISERKKDRVGIWTLDKNHNEAKIAAIGIRVRKWITFHGVAINVSPNLDHYKGIIPCGIKEFGVTSLKDLGYNITYAELDKILQRKFSDFF